MRHSPVFIWPVLVAILAGGIGAPARAGDARPGFTYVTGKAFLSSRCSMAQAARAGTESLQEFAIEAAAEFMPVLVRGLSGVMAKVLRERTADYTAVTEFRIADTLYQTRQTFSSQSQQRQYTMKHQCVMLVRGPFGAANASAASAPWTADRLQKLGLAGPPDFYLELAIRYFNSMRSFALSPVYLDFARTKAKTEGKAHKKDLFICVSLYSTQMREGGAVRLPFAAFTLAMESVPIGSRLDERALGGLTTEAYFVPPVIEKDKQVDLVAFDGSITVTETENAGAIYSALAEALEDKKDDAGTAGANVLRGALGSGKQ